MASDKSDLVRYELDRMDAQNLEFAFWMQDVDTIVQRLVGLSVYDLPDQSYYDWFEDDLSPDDAAKDALAEVGLSFPDR